MRLEVCRSNTDFRDAVLPLDVGVDDGVPVFWRLLTWASESGFSGEAELLESGIASITSSARSFALSSPLWLRLRESVKWSSRDKRYAQAIVPERPFPADKQASPKVGGDADEESYLYNEEQQLCAGIQTARHASRARQGAVKREVGRWAEG